MTTEERARAASSAGERLEEIAAWSKRTFIAATVCAAVTTGTCGYGLFEYIRIKMAVSSAASEMAKGFQDAKTEMAKSFEKSKAEMAARWTRK